MASSSSRWRRGDSHALFLGRELEMVSRPGDARAQWERAATLCPAAQSPLLALSRLEHSLVRAGEAPQLAEASGGSLFEVGSPHDLGAIFLRILEDFRLRYLLAYTPRGVPDGGWHRLEVRVNRRAAQVRVRSGYLRGPAKGN